MADSKLSALTEATSLGESDEFYTNDSGTSKRITLANLRGSLTAASKAELDILNGATLSTAELNYVDGVTSAIQTQIDNIWTTGDAKLTIKTSADTGWILADDGTIGSAASGASNRANADTEDLYTLLWTNFSDTYAPVTGGRGASAAADFAADKPIQVGTILGRAIAIAGSGSGLTARTLGAALGEEEHTLTEAELAAHTHSGTTDSGGAHTHSLHEYMGTIGDYSGEGVEMSDNEYSLNSGEVVSGGAHTHTLTTGSTGSGDAHNNMQPTTFMNVMLKL